jgi:uncharacterized protein
MKMMTDKKFFSIKNVLFAGVMALSLFAGFTGLSKDSYAKGYEAYKNPDTGYTVVIEDEASLLSESEELALIDVMIPLTKYGCIGFVSTNYNNTSQKYYAEARSHENFGRMVPQSVFLIDMDNRQIYIYSDNANYKVITDAKATYITDNIYKDATAGDYYLCAYRAYEQMYTLLNGGQINEPMRHISAALLGILFSMLICFIIISAHAKLKQPSVEELLKVTQRDVKASEPSVMLEKQTKKYSPQSSGSGGGGGGGGGHSGGGGGGGHSGGGGGHGF